MSSKSFIAFIASITLSTISFAIPEIGSKSDLNLLIENSKSVPVIIDYYLPWCGPCKAMAPILDEISAQCKDKVKFVKINFDANEKLGNPEEITALTSGITAAPTFVFIKDGKEVSRHTGRMSKDDFSKRVKKAFGIDF
jgi:thioredoxin 1